ncbi:MAG TPA: hypothetical protein VLV81_10395 [Acidimicrobiia bacterium]|nr:hypothetical protein [Acidimicrobiia bacterium]
MAIVVILVLGILWAAVLLPPILRSRAEGGGSGVSGGVGELMSMFTSAFGRTRGNGDHDLPAMQPLMGPVGPVASVGAMRGAGSMSSAQKRRRDVLIGLLVAAGITLVMALFSGGSIMFVVLHLLADACLGAYVYLLIQMKSRQRGRQAQLRPVASPGRHLRSIPGMGAEPKGTRGEPALLLRRTATY